MPDDTTTEAPPPAPATTAAPVQQSTNPPASTTAAPAQQSTNPPASTTAAPAQQSTNPPASTTAAPGSSAGPAFDASPTVQIDPDDGTAQSPPSYQVSTDAKLTLSWSASSAAGVSIDGLGDFGASGSSPLPSQDASYNLVPKAADGTAGTPFTITIATHAPGDVVSPHASVSSGVAAVLSFTASKDGQSITAASSGDTVTITAVVSDSTDSCTINGQSASLSDAGGGNLQASVSVTLASPMSGDFDCQVSAQGAPGQPGSLHIAINTAPASTTTNAPASTTTNAPPSTTTNAPSSTTTNAPPSTTTDAPPSTTTPAAPSTTTTAAPPTTTTAGEEPYTTIWNNMFVWNLPKAEAGEHLAFTLGISFVGTLECKTAGAAPVSELPGPWQQKVQDGFTAKWSIPMWQSYLQGGKWTSKSYTDFWSHFTFVDSSVSKSGAATAKTEITANIAEYDVGELDFGAQGAAPAAQAKLSVSVAQVNCVEVWKSAFGVATGSYSVNLVTDVITDGDYKLTGTYQVVGQVELKGPSLEDVVEKIAANPEVIAGVAIAAAVLGVAIVLIWVEIQIESVDIAEALPSHIASAYSDGVWSAFTNDGIQQWSDSSGDQTSYFLNGKKAGSDWLAANPNATDDQKQAGKSQALSGAAAWAKNTVFASYKAQGRPADLVNELHQRLFGTPDPDYKGPLPEGGAP